MFLSGCGTLSKIELDHNSEQAERYSRNGDLELEVRELAEPLVTSGHTPGILVAVLTADGKKQYFSYGVADKTTKVRLDADTLFPVGSLSKGFLADIITLMIFDGRLSWQDTLESLLPAGTPLSEDAKKITLKQLATHTSGLPRQPWLLQTLAYFVEYEFTGNNFYRHFDQDYLFQYLTDFSAPDEFSQQYSNIGYALLGYILELHSGKSLDQLLAEKVLIPMQLESTGYKPENITSYSNIATGYAGDHPLFMRRGAPVPNWVFTDIMKGSAALHTTARDLLFFAEAHLCADDSDYCHAIRDTLKVRYPQDKEAAAIAWIEDKVDDQRIIYQIGLVAGFTSYLGINIENRTAVVVFQNSFNFGNSIGHRLLIRMAKAKKLVEPYFEARRAAN